MSPELQRNLWLETTPTRLALMAGFWALVSFAVIAVTGQIPVDQIDSDLEVNIQLAVLSAVGLVGYVVIVILWGTRNAARSVIGELRERTWDFQRLSAIRPMSMTFGKLFGATSYVWFGGAITLLMVAPGLLQQKPGEEGLATLGLMVASGLLGHAAAMGSALFAARRRRTDARVAIFPHQLVGLVAAILPVWLHYTGAARDALTNMLGYELPAVDWYGLSYGDTTFVFLTSAVFAAWAIVGCWRLMRLELMATNAPIVWPAFLAFLIFYFAGYAGVFVPGLALAYMGVATAAIVAALVEPKNYVELRAFGAAVAGGRIGEAANRAPAYVWAFLFAAGVALFVASQGTFRVGSQNVYPHVWIAALGFLARDISVFLFFHANPRARRGDFASIVTLVVLHGILAGIVSTTHSEFLMALVKPMSHAPAVYAVFPWAEAALVLGLALSRFRKTPAPAPDVRLAAPA